MIRRIKRQNRILSIIAVLIIVFSVVIVFPQDSYAADQGGSDTSSNILIAKVVAKGSHDLVISWTRVDGADGYDVSIYQCKDGPLKAVASKTFKGNTTFSWTGKKLKKHTAYKVIVVAWTMKDGIKTPLITTPFPRPRLHAYTSGGTKKYTNPKSVTVSKSKVTLKEGSSYRIKAKVNKLHKGRKLINHDAKLRYFSTDTEVAKVNTTGKITAMSKGKCNIYVYAVNGVWKKIAVNVD